MAKAFRPTAILQKARQLLGCKGVLLAISENGAVKTYSAGSISSADHHRPYYIYSISKTFTAVAIMKLCEDQGDFLDEPVSPLFPGRNIPDEVTVRQLLNHTSGLSDYFASPAYQRAVKERPHKPWGYEKLMEWGLSRTPLFEAGQGWSYSNPGYGLLKELIEKQSRMPYYDYLTAVIIKKAVLSATRPFLEPDYKLQLLEGEAPCIKGDFRPRYHPGWIATGCFISTVSDVARFYDTLFNGSLLSPKSVSAMMTTVDVLPDPPKESIPAYGLGLMHGRKSPLGDAYGHGGGGPGYTTYAVHYLNLEGNAVTISIVLNKSLVQTPLSLADEIVRHYIESKNYS